MLKINRSLLPVKAHYFFFMASMGPILPFTIVFGKQLGISEIVMGTITAILPILFLVAKPAFGFIVDYFQRQRKMVFMILIFVMCGAHVLLYFVPQSSSTSQSMNSVYTGISCLDISSCRSQNSNETGSAKERRNGSVNCTQTSKMQILANQSFDTGSSADKCSLLTFGLEGECAMNPNVSFLFECKQLGSDSQSEELYNSITFWSFVLLMAVGSICYNVANSISDAICFDVLGKGGEMEYGKQRVFGAIGFGLSALLAGYVIDLCSTDDNMKNYAPAFLLTLVFALVDLLTCSKLKLPKLPKSESILGDISGLLKHWHINVFLAFATLAGVCDSFIIYFMFWYLEDLALASGSMSHVKLIEGLVIAAETLGGEVIFFSYAGKIIERLGYENCMSISFAFYALRLGLIAMASNPWWLLPTELFLQGPSYALSYTTIVAYASAVAPPGTSATMQGLVAGMDDGFGYAIGSLCGGVLYRWLGGSWSFLLFSGLALFCAVAHSILHACCFRSPAKPTADTCSADYKVVSQTAPEAKHSARATPGELEAY